MVDPATTCGAWPSATTARAGTGGGSPGPIRASSPEGPDRLQVGWRLVVPEDATTPAAKGERSVTVRRGETLSSIAERELGSADRWRELYRANRTQLADPDQLAVGMVLAIPAVGAPERADRDEPRVEQEIGGERASQPEERPGPRPDATTEPTPQPTTESTPAAEPASPAEPAPPTDPDAGEGDESDEASGYVVPLVAIGALLAAGLLEGLAWRRSVQLQTRPRGRRIPLRRRRPCR